MITSVKPTSLLDLVQSSLRLSSFSQEFGDVRISVQGGKVHLTGTVSSYYHKQLAIEACRHVAGVKGCSDALSVEYPTEQQ